MSGLPNNKGGRTTTVPTKLDTLENGLPSDAASEGRVSILYGTLLKTVNTFFLEVPTLRLALVFPAGVSGAPSMSA